MKNIIELILFLSDSISIVLNNIVSLIVYPLNILASILYGIGERCGLIVGEEEQEPQQEEGEGEHKIGFHIPKSKNKDNIVM